MKVTKHDKQVDAANVEVGIKMSAVERWRGFSQSPKDVLYQKVGSIESGYICVMANDVSKENLDFIEQYEFQEMGKVKNHTFIKSVRLSVVSFFKLLVIMNKSKKSFTELIEIMIDEQYKKEKGS